MPLRGFKIDRYLLLLLGTVAVASILPVRGAAAQPAHVLTNVAIGLLFFLHGAKLSREAIVKGIGAWRIHLAVLAATFVMFPILGLGMRAAIDHWIDPTIGSGILLLCLMPSTVQSSIAFTSIARGNVPAAVCSASASNVLGVFLTPFLAGIFLSGKNGDFSSSGVINIALQLLLPFVLGHLLRPFFLGILERDKAFLAKVDRSVILLVVYTAFSAAVVDGLWQRYSIADLAWTLVLDAALLATALILTIFGARALGFNKADEVVVVFCGSKKSLTSGVPIAGALFPAAAVGPMIVPLMLFHQLQLMACAVLAQRYAQAAESQLAAAVAMTSDGTQETKAEGASKKVLSA
ncbi:MAG: bile acid:sodium symporter family protein [Janthinobacterium lividum]